MTKNWDDSSITRILEETEISCDNSGPYLQRIIHRTCEQLLYNPNFDDDAICICGHSYHRHFDSYEHNKPVGCKCCDCYYFTQSELTMNPTVFSCQLPHAISEQWDGNRKHPLIVTCTGGGQGNLKPVPAGLEVMGATKAGVKTAAGLVEIHKGDWLLTQLHTTGNDVLPVVVPDAIFTLLYKSDE